MIIFITVLTYFLILLAISRLTSRPGRSVIPSQSHTPISPNDTFFLAGRRSPWYLVAFGMVGASISGVSFISVPGMSLHSDMTYLQMCLGFIPGYIAVAFILLPIFYRLQRPSIYSWLGDRFGPVTMKTGSALFLISKMAGTVVKFYVVCTILQHFVFAPIGIPFHANVTLLVLLIWLYTRRSGIKTLVWTDTFQTLCMFGALILITIHVITRLDMTASEAIRAIADSPHSHIFNFTDWHSRTHFVKQFISGIFIVIVMTGLDQDMMQKNMTCKTLRDAQKDMCTSGVLFLPANLLLLSLGILLIILAGREGITLPSNTDDILPMFAASGHLGTPVVILFTIGIVAACFSSADSALTSITTSFCVDILNRPNDEKARKTIHFATAILFIILILAFNQIHSTNLLDAIYTIVSYTYGPLLGLYTFGLTTRRRANDRSTPIIALLSPILCYIISQCVLSATGYHFGYELLLLNGLLTFLFLHIRLPHCKRLLSLLALSLLTSCTIVRGYMADGAYGPTSFSYEKQLKDTIINRGNVFSFDRASETCNWIDTLHFFNQGKRYVNNSMWEAIGPKTETQGVLIIQNDSIVYEKCTGDMGIDKIACVFSVTKSVTSLLCGIAVDEGFIKSIDDPVTYYLHELLKEDPMWQKLTIRHLLDMRSGLDFDDTYSLSLKSKDIKRVNAMAKLYYGRNIMAQVKKLKFRCEPGTEYQYQSMTTEILGLVIERATGCRYADYLEEKVWTPLGMESPAFLSYDSKKHHAPHAFGGLALTMLDLAKIGRLYLNQGVWNGKRIVSESWIEQSSAYSEDNKGYHFCWYNTSCIGAEKAEYPGYYAAGIRGQILFVNPYKNLIMVRFGLKDDTYAHIPYLFEQLSNLWPE